VRDALVTGGRGFVGAWLCRALLERGVEVVSFDRRTPRERPSTLELIGVEDAVTEEAGSLVDGDLRRFVNVYVSGEDIRFQDGLETSLADGAEVTILPAVAGG
jgi:nucleoside-diphosphate-sugar epimerase